MNTPFGKLIGKNIFGKILLLLISVGVIYGAAMNSYAIGSLSGNIWLSVAIGLLYIAMGICGLTQKSITEKWRNRILEIIINFSSCLFIYDFMFLALWGILIAILPIPETAAAAGVLCADLLAAITVALGFLHAKNIKLASYKIEVGLKDPPYRIALLSDLHLGVFVGEKQIRNMVDTVNTLDADVVVICGDIIDSNNHILANNEALDKISAVFKKIHTKEGVFAVLGNHDPKADDEKFRDFMLASDIQLLHNQIKHLSKINLIGRTNASNNHRSPITDFSGQIDAAKPVVVLDHDPADIPEAVEFGADLVLCGHTHKGQFFPITYFTKLANGRHYFYGLEKFGKTHAIISSGAGFFQLPVRIGTNSEVVDIQLKGPDI